MVSDRVGDAVEAAARISSVDDDRFAGDVGRSRDQCQIGGGGNPVDAGGTPEQFPDHQPVQRCMGRNSPTVGSPLETPCASRASSRAGTMTIGRSRAASSRAETSSSAAMR